MVYLVWTTLALAHLVGMAITHGTERRRTFKPDPIVYLLWELWLLVAAAGWVGGALRDGLRWTLTALDDLGYRFSGRL